MAKYVNKDGKLNLTKGDKIVLTLVGIGALFGIANKALSNDEVSANKTGISATTPAVAADVPSPNK